MKREKKEWKIIRGKKRGTNERQDASLLIPAKDFKFLFWPATVVEAGREKDQGSPQSRRGGEVEKTPLCRSRLRRISGAGSAVAEGGTGRSTGRSRAREALQHAGQRPGSPLSGRAERGVACGKLPPGRIGP